VGLSAVGFIEKEKIKKKMKFTQLIKLIACAVVIAGLSILSACKKDDVIVVVPPVKVEAIVKCDYSPYANGSKFVFTSSNGLVTDTIIGDTTINGIGYAKILSVGVTSNGVPYKALAFTRCDANGVYTLFDKSQFGGSDVINFKAKEMQTIKLPASVGLSWKSDTIKYSASGLNIASIYQMTETAVGGTVVANGTTYANDLITVQVKVYSTITYLGVTTIDTADITSTIFDKTAGVIQVSQNGGVIKALKSAIIK
jgi:hypothetical protein